MAERCLLYQNNSKATSASPEQGLHTSCHIGNSALVPLHSSLALKGYTKPFPVIVMPTWCGNQDHVHACMTILLRPVHILSDIMATYADKEITQQRVLRCCLDMCVMAQAFLKYGLLPSLIIVKCCECFWQFELLGLIWTLQRQPLTSPAGHWYLSVSTLFYWLLIPLQNVKALTFWSQSVN